MLRTLLLLVTLLVVAGCLGGGPSDSEIQGALQDHYASSLQDQIDKMTVLFGEKRAKETVFSANGIQDLSELEVKSLSVENVRALDNGDQIAKVAYVISYGTSDEIQTEQLTLTELEGHWKIIMREVLH